MSGCPWHKNDDALQKIAVFHPLWLLTSPAWELSWAPLGVAAPATRTMQLLAEFPMSSSCEHLLQFCVCKGKGVPSPFLLARELRGEGSHKAGP